MKKVTVFFTNQTNNDRDMTDRIMENKKQNEEIF